MLTWAVLTPSHLLRSLTKKLQSTWQLRISLSLPPSLCVLSLSVSLIKWLKESMYLNPVVKKLNKWRIANPQLSVTSSHIAASIGTLPHLIARFYMSLFYFLCMQCDSNWGSVLLQTRSCVVSLVRILKYVTIHTDSFSTSKRLPM